MRTDALARRADVGRMRFLLDRASAGRGKHALALIGGGNPASQSASGGLGSLAFDRSDRDGRVADVDAACRAYVKIIVTIGPQVN